MKKLINIILIFTFLASYLSPAFAQSMASEFLCEVGVKLYNQGRYQEALHEFKKALIVKPNYKLAQNYINLIRRGGAQENEMPSAEPEPFVTIPVEALPKPYPQIKNTLPATLETEPAVVSAPRKKKPMFIETEPIILLPEPAEGQLTAAEKALEYFEREQLPPGGERLQTEKIAKKEYQRLDQIQNYPIPTTGLSPIKQAAQQKILVLDETLKYLLQPIEIAKDESFIIEGSNITRYLITQPDILYAHKKNPDELELTGKDIGYTYVHVWDDNGRWTLEFLGTPKKPEGPTYEEMMRREAESARNFKLRYSLDWTSYESGPSLDNLKRSNSYVWIHSLGLTGPSPYGELGAGVAYTRYKKSTELTYAGFSLANGTLGPFKGFTIRGGDLTPPLSNLAFGGTYLRGGMLSSPVFNNKINYLVFTGRENASQSAAISRDVYKIKNHFLDGANVSFTPSEKQNYAFTVVHGRGRDREDYLNRYGYDSSNTWIIGKWNVNYELGNDSETFAHLLNARYSVPKLNFSTQFRDIAKKYLSITGNGSQQGELGTLFNLTYTPSETLSLTQRLDIYQDRLYPAEDNIERWNQDYDWALNYQIDPLTNINFNYMLQNNLGQLSQMRYQNAGFNVSRTIKTIRDLHTSFGYLHQENKNYSTPSIDYINDKINLGLRFNFISNLYYYITKEYNWLQEKYTGTNTMPHALETGLSWSSQLGKSPFYGSWRFSYRDEENTFSNLSLLSGEDYIEGYTELTFKHSDDLEMYANCRIRNSWADNPNITKRIEANFNVGMRYLWDTGFKWDSVCTIEGYVFKDYNSDGVKQKDEPPVEGIKIWTGKDKYATTDLFGYYQFKGIRGAKAYVNLDMSSLPSGYLATVPSTQEVVIVNHQTAKVDFGIISQSGISGTIYDDVNGNGIFDQGEKGIAGIVIMLGDGRKTTTDRTGKYYLNNVSTGEVTVDIDLNSIPIYYLPKTSISQKINLFEGITYQLNVPLHRIKE